jgi:hypothetical protein
MRNPFHLLNTKRPKITSINKDMQKLCLVGTAIMENCIIVSQKNKIELPCWSGIPLLGLNPKELKRRPQRDICISKFMLALFIVAKSRHNQLFLGG